MLQIACDEGQERVVAEIMPENSGMRRVCTKLGFEFERIPKVRTTERLKSSCSGPRPWRSRNRFRNMKSSLEPGFIEPGSSYRFFVRN